MSSKRASILFVDDHRLLVEGLKQLFRKRAEVRGATSGEQALELIHEQAPDVIVSDIIRPGVNGIDLLNILRTDPATRHIPFVFFTTQSGELRRRALMQGCDEVISKGEPVTYLEARIVRLLERAEALRQVENPPPHAEPLRVFICHAKEDATSAQRICNFLIRNGIDAWIDDKDLIPGQEWDTEIRRALRSSHLIVVCLSNASISKTGYVQKEIRLALDLADERPPGSVFIVPLRIEECAVPDRLSKWHWLDYFRPHARTKLLRTLSDRADALGLLKPRRAGVPDKGTPPRDTRKRTRVC